MIGPEPVYTEGELPSGQYFRLWVAQRWIVLEVAGRVTFAPEGRSVPAEVAADMAVALFECYQ